MGSLFEHGNQYRAPKVIQVTGTPQRKTLARIDQLLVILPERVPAALWRKIPQGTRVKKLMRRRKPGATPAIATRLNNERQTALYVGAIGSSADPFELLTFARKMLAVLGAEKAGCVGIWVEGFAASEQLAILESMSAAALAAAFIMPEFKSKATPPRIRSLRLIGHAHQIDLNRIEAEAEGNNAARWLTALPANKLDAISYVSYLKDAAKANGWQFKKYAVSELEKMGAGAFLAVAQGNDDDSAAIVRLRYRPDGKAANPALSLVGKGIIFDTGGNSRCSICISTWVAARLHTERCLPCPG